MSKSSEEGAAGNASPQDTGVGSGGPKDTNENIFDNRAGTKKIIRVVTVMAYVFSVSFAAILLSAYYVFLWEPPNPRLQRHPFTGDPHAESLIDNLLPHTDINKLEVSKFENPNTKLNIFKRIMTNDQEVINDPKKLESFPQNLLAYEDILELHYKSATKPDDSAEDTIASRPTIINDVPKGTGTSGNTLTTLPIFLKTYTTMATQLTGGSGQDATTLPSSRIIPTRTLTHQGDGKKSEKESRDIKIVDLLIGRNMSSLSHDGKNFGLLEDSKILTKRNELKNESNDLKVTPEIMNNEGASSASSESNTLSVISTGDMETTVYPGIDNYSYPGAIEDTMKNDKVTIGIEETTETSTLRVPVVAPELVGNIDTNLRKHESMVSEDPVDEGLTTTSEVQIYPVGNGEDILENDE